MCWYWCHSFYVLQSFRQRHRAAMKKNRLRSFSLSFVLFTHKSRRFPQSFFSFHLSFHVSISSLLLPHQGKARLRFAIWISNARCFTMHHKHKSHVYEFAANSLCFVIETNPWQVKKRGNNLSYIPVYHLTLHVKVKVKISVVSQPSFGSWQQHYSSVTVCCSSGTSCLWTLKSTQRKKTRLFWMKRKKPWSTAL